MTSRILAALAALLVSAGSAEAGVLTYSGYLLDPQGKPVTTSTTLQFRFYPGSAGGAVIWEDVVAVAPGADGWFSAVLGANGSNPLDAADFAQQLWLAIKVSTDAQEMSPRMRIGTAPYALTVPWNGVQGKPISFPVDPAVVQSRVTGTCGAGQFMTGVGETGTVTCATDATGTGDITGVIAGAGLTGGGLAGDVTLAVNTAVMQARVTGTCAAGTSIRAIDAAGAVTCETDDNTVYAAGSGLALAGTMFSTDNAVVARKDAAAGNQTFDGGTLHLDYTNNRVGVNTTAPGAALEVAGTVTANDLAYRTGFAKPSAFTVSGVNFTPDQGAVTVEYINSGYLYLTGTTTRSQLYAPVHVPDGAALGAFTCWFYDGDATNDLSYTMSLFTKAPTATGATTLATAAGATTGTSTVMQSGSATATHTVNTDNAYYFMVYMTGPASSSLRFYGCRVSYTMTGPAY